MQMTITRARRHLAVLIAQLERIDTATVDGTVTYTPELDCARAQLIEEIADLTELLGDDGDASH